MPTARPFTATPPPPGLMPTQAQAQKDVQRLLAADKSSKNYKNLIQDILFRYGSFDLFREAAGLDLPGPSPGPPGMPPGMPPMVPETLPGGGMPDARAPVPPRPGIDQAPGAPQDVQNALALSLAQTNAPPTVPPPGVALGGPPGLEDPAMAGAGLGVPPPGRGGQGRGAAVAASAGYQSLPESIQAFFAGFGPGSPGYGRNPRGGGGAAPGPAPPPPPPPPPGVQGMMGAGMPGLENPDMPPFVPPPAPPPGPPSTPPLAPPPGPPRRAPRVAQSAGDIEGDTGRQASTHELITRLQGEAMVAQQPQGGGGLSGLMTQENLMEFGLRMMAASEAQPGTTVGPSLLGAVGQAGLGTLGGVRRRKAATTKAEAKERHHQDTIAVKREAIQANKDLRKATLQLKDNTDQFRNELAAQRNQISIGQLGLSISTEERKTLDDLKKTIPYMVADPKEQRRAEREVRREFDSIRRANRVAPLGSGGGASAKGQWVPVK